MKQLFVRSFKEEQFLPPTPERVLALRSPFVRRLLFWLYSKSGWFWFIRLGQLERTETFDWWDDEVKKAIADGAIEPQEDKYTYYGRT